MSQILQFEDIVAWQRARALTTSIYKTCQAIRDRSFNDQMQRAALSVMNNIAEGFERRSNKEFKQFLFIAKGSCGEVRSMIWAGVDVGYVDDKTADALINLTLEISRLLPGFIKKL